MLHYIARQLEEECRRTRNLRVGKGGKGFDFEEGSGEGKDDVARAAGRGNEGGAGSAGEEQQGMESAAVRITKELSSVEAAGNLAPARPAPPSFAPPSPRASLTCSALAPRSPSLIWQGGSAGRRRAQR